jgi:cytochrome c553
MKMTSFVLGSLALLAVSGTVLAGEPSSKLAWTPENLALVKNGNAAKGKQLAETCGACHGNGQQEVAGAFPYLQGQLATYLYKQLKDYKDGSRGNAIMAGLVSGLSDQDMADLAAWYSQQPVPAGAKNVLPHEAAGQLVSRGDSKRILPPCQSCHEPNGKGQRIDVPGLAGQNAAYTEQTLQDYKSEARHNDLYGRMRSITQQLSDEEIRALAHYYAGLGH